MIKTTQEDSELIQKILNGNPQAQEILYEKYRKNVKSILIGKYSLYFDIDDDVSEIMIKVMMNLIKFDDIKSKFSSWVFSIAKNHMIDKWRSNNVTLYSDNLSTDNGYITSTSSLMIDFENNSSINFITEQLTPQDYTLLNMKYMQGYDYNEIGNEFNLTSSTVSNRVNYIKTILKKNNPEIIYQ